MAAACPGPDLCADPAAIAEALQVIRPVGAILLVSIDPLQRHNNIQARTFIMPGEAGQASAWAAELNNSGLNLYFTPNLARPMNKKAGKEDMLRAFSFWADCDPQIFKHQGNYAAARAYLIDELLPAARTQASYIIDSGNGLQPVFNLREPLDIEHDWAAFEALNKVVGEFWEGPNTYNCDRVLRLPGTVNFPNDAKLKKGYPQTPSMARLVHVSDRKMTLADVRRMVRSADPLQERFESYLSGHPVVAARYAGDRSGLNDTSGSAMDFSMVSMLKFGGFSLEECRKLLEHWRHGSTSEDRQHDRYWQRCYSRTSEVDRPSVDFSVLLGEKLAKAPPAAVEELSFPVDLLEAPGMLGVAMRWMLDCAQKPQPVLALAASISLLATCLAQKVRSHTGLRTNMYLVGVGDTSAGKDHGRKCIKAALQAAQLDSLLGGEEIASGQGLLSRVALQPCTVFQLDEFGLLLKAINGRGAGVHLQQIGTNLMKLFTSAGSVYTGAEYANQKDRPRTDIEYPCTNLHATTTPDSLFDAFSGADVTSGNLNRLLILFAPEAQGNWPMRFTELSEPPAELIEWMKTARTLRHDMAGLTPSNPIRIGMTSEAMELFEALYDHQQTQERARRVAGTGHLYGRLWEHASKLALIAACARYTDAQQLAGLVGQGQVVVDSAAAAWGIALARYIVAKMDYEVASRVADSEFGQTKQRVHRSLTKAGAAGMTERELAKANRTFSGLNPRERDAVLTALQRDGAIFSIEFKPPSGRGRSRFALVCSEFHTHPDDEEQDHE